MLYRHDFRAMGSNITVMMDLTEPISKKDPAALFLDCERHFEKWEKTFSRFLMNSELSKINMNAGIPTKVSKEFMEVLDNALISEKMSAGLIRPTLNKQLIRAGYDRSIEIIRETDRQMHQEAAWERNASSQEILVDKSKLSVTLPYDIALDLNGSVKGWAAHQIVDVIYPEYPTLVSAGGDIAVNKPMLNGDKWHITIEDPFDESTPIANLGITNCYVATSGTYKRNWLLNGERQHHIIDPRTGFPASTDVISATVISNDPTKPEVAAKSALILGSRRGLEWINDQGDCAVFLIREDGKVLYNDLMEQYFWS